MDEFTGVDGSMSLADAGKRNMLEDIKSFQAVKNAKFMKFYDGMDTPGLVVTIDDFTRKAINREFRRGIDRGTYGLWSERFVEFVEPYGYEYDGAEPLNLGRVAYYFLPV